MMAMQAGRAGERFTEDYTRHPPQLSVPKSQISHVLPRGSLLRLQATKRRVGRLSPCTRHWF